MNNFAIKSEGDAIRRRSPLIGSIILIGVGVIFLLLNLLHVTDIRPAILSLAFAVGCAIFAGILQRNPERAWWAAIPASALLGLSAAVFIGAYAPGHLKMLAGAAELAALSLGFAVVYLLNRTRWWAIIPAGVLASLALTLAMSSVGDVPSAFFDGLFLMGIGATFLAVARTREGDRQRRWALIPARVLLVVGFFMTAARMQSLDSMRLVIPVALIVVGGWFVYEVMSRRDE